MPRRPRRTPRAPAQKSQPKPCPCRPPDCLAREIRMRSPCLPLKERRKIPRGRPCQGCPFEEKAGCGKEAKTTTPYGPLERMTGRADVEREQASISAFSPITEAELIRARRDPAFRQRLLQQSLDTLLGKLQKERQTTCSAAA